MGTPMSRSYDAIIVGARCAGSPTAMLLARKGWRVLLIDRATFPSDTVSTHLVQPRGIACMERWGVLNSLATTGCPPIHTYSIDFDTITISGTPGSAAAPTAYCPRRTILDKLLLEAAADAGAEIREDCDVEHLVFEGERIVGIKATLGRGQITERAEVIVGADGRNSLVAKSAQVNPYNETPPLSVLYYAYWSGLPMDGRFETYNRANRLVSAAPTNDGLTLITVAWPFAEFRANKSNVEVNYSAAIALIPEFAGRLGSARRETRVAGMAVSNYFRKPFGPGWVLVGDAGYNKDPITAQGIADAFVDAESCANTLDKTFAGSPFKPAFEEHHRARDQRVMRMYELTCRAAKLEPLSPDMRDLFRLIQGDQDSMDDFVRMNAGTISPSEFWSPKMMRSMMTSRRASR